MSIPTMTPGELVDFAGTLELYEEFETWIAPDDMEGICPQVFVGRMAIRGCLMTLIDGSPGHAFKVKVVRLL